MHYKISMEIYSYIRIIVSLHMINKLCPLSKGFTKRVCGRTMDIEFELKIL